MIFGTDAPVFLVNGVEITLTKPTNRYVDFLKESDKFETNERKFRDVNVIFRLYGEFAWNTIDLTNLTYLITVINAPTAYFKIHGRYFEFRIEEFAKPHWKDKNIYEGAKLIIEGRNPLSSYPNPDTWHGGALLINRIGINPAT